MQLKSEKFPISKFFFVRHLWRFKCNASIVKLRRKKIAFSHFNCSEIVLWTYCQTFWVDRMKETWTNRNQSDFCVNNLKKNAKTDETNLNDSERNALKMDIWKEEKCIAFADELKWKSEEEEKKVNWNRGVCLWFVLHKMISI